MPLFDLICYDFDGVMTDNRVLVDENGLEAVMVNRGDGLAVGLIAKLGIPQVIISTETNKVVSARGHKLKLFVLQGIENKAQALEEYAQSLKVDLARTVFIGNDINDLEAMLKVGFPVAPNDAHSSVKEIAKLVTKAKGGYGVIREFYDFLISDNGSL